MTGDERIATLEAALARVYVLLQHDEFISALMVTAEALGRPLVDPDITPEDIIEGYVIREDDELKELGQ